ncbi:MAG: TetR/AcrR family transcriptional regulator [Alphaproteobacteria bacterium]
MPATSAKRKPTRDAAATRERILKAAKLEFAKKGLGGARVDEIAERAMINKRMLYVYFGNKEDLFLAVLEEAYADIRRAETRLELEHLEPIEALATLVRFTWSYYLKHPEFLRLVNSENLHRARHLKRSARIKDMHSPFIRLIGDLLERGVEAGVFRSGIDPNQLYISIAALGYYYLTNRHTLSVIYGRNLGAAPALDERFAAIEDMVFRTVLKVPEKG